ncbi:MAG: hypothetical protein II348_01055 [Clostridia bacterium]|nr:hypothetical protein [Clostridia bacterium]
MRKHWFKITLLVFASVCTVVACVFLGLLWNAMEAFEANSEIGAMDAYFSRFSVGDYTTAAETSDFPFDEKSTKEEYIRFLKAEFGSEFSDFRFSESMNDGSEEKLYTVYRGAERLGEVRLIPQQGEDRNWRVVAVTRYADPLVVEAPNYVTVFANGTEQTPPPGEHPVLKEFESLTQYPDLPRTVTYRLEGYLFPPEISLKSPQGTTCATVEGEDGKLLVSVTPDGILSQQCWNLLVDFSKLYARYISRDAELEELTVKLKQNTPLYESILSYDTKYVISHTGYEFRDLQVSDVVWGNNYLSGTVTFDYIVFRGKTEFKYPSQYHLLLAKEQGRWVVVDMMSY